jgi:hypothetical protein
MQLGRLILVRTDAATQFRGSLAQNAVATLNLAAPTGPGQTDGYLDQGLAAGGVVTARVRTITLVSIENLAWEIQLWGKDTFGTYSVLNDLVPFGLYTFQTGDGKRNAGAGPYIYYVSGLDIPYVDLDKSGELHLALVNRSAAAKTAGDAGALFVQLGMEPSLGW